MVTLFHGHESSCSAQEKKTYPDLHGLRRLQFCVNYLNARRARGWKAPIDKLSDGESVQLLDLPAVAGK